MQVYLKKKISLFSMFTDPLFAYSIAKLRLYHFPASIKSATLLQSDQHIDDISCFSFILPDKQVKADLEWEEPHLDDEGRSKA